MIRLITTSSTSVHKSSGFVLSVATKRTFSSSTFSFSSNAAKEQEQDQTQQTVWKPNYRHVVEKLLDEFVTLSKGPHGDPMVDAGYKWEIEGGQKKKDEERLVHWSDSKASPNGVLRLKAVSPFPEVRRFVEIHWVPRIVLVHQSVDDSFVDPKLVNALTELRSIRTLEDIHLDRIRSIQSPRLFLTVDQALSYLEEKDPSFSSTLSASLPSSSPPVSISSDHSFYGAPGKKEKLTKERLLQMARFVREHDVTKLSQLVPQWNVHSGLEVPAEWTLALKTVSWPDAPYDVDYPVDYTQFFKNSVVAHSVMKELDRLEISDIELALGHPERKELLGHTLETKGSHLTRLYYNLRSKNTHLFPKTVFANTPYETIVKDSF